MTTATILLNLDLAAGTAALVAIAMMAVPNVDRIRIFWRMATPRPARRRRAQISDSEPFAGDLALSQAG